MFTWPWQRAGKRHDGQLAVACSPEAFAYAQAGRDGQLLRCGLLEAGGDTPAEFARRVRALGLPERDAWAVLPLSDAQLLAVDAPAVRPEEMKAAARWRIKDLVDTRLDELTIDVMVAGNPDVRPHRQVLVAAAKTSLLRALGERMQAQGMALAVVDLAETAQRNLQHATAVAEGLAERATAALMRHGAQCLLTVCAGGELYYTRRLDWEDLPGALPLASNAPTEMGFSTDNPDFVDYGAGTDDTMAVAEGAPRLVVELQRSFDVWERSWPDLPLAALWVQVGDGSAALATLLQDALGHRVGVLEPARVFSNFDAVASDPDVRAAMLPLIGGLLRQETRTA